MNLGATHLGGGGRQVGSFNRCGLRGYAADYPHLPHSTPVNVGVGADDSDVATARQHGATYIHRTITSGGDRLVGAPLAKIQIVKQILSHPIYYYRRRIGILWHPNKNNY